MHYWPGMLADADSEDANDRDLHQMGPFWKAKVIGRALLSGDREAWTIVVIFVVLIVLLVVAKKITRKMLKDD